MVICEAWMEHVIATLKMDPIKVRELNIYQEGQQTHYRQTLAKTDSTIRRCWNEVLERSNYAQLRKEVDAFNAANRNKKQGLCCLPTKFGMSFTFKSLNQAGALVHVYTDGSVLVSHGGTEMGQGLHPKMAQIAAHTLDVPLDDVYIAETATDKVPNSSPTAASVQSDLNGMAVFNACKQIAERLAPRTPRCLFPVSHFLVRAANPGKTLKELARQAWLQQINLSAQGYFSRPDIGYDFEASKGKPFAYFVTGAAVSHVEVDVLTGDFQVRSFPHPQLLSAFLI